MQEFCRIFLHSRSKRIDQLDSFSRRTFCGFDIELNVWTGKRSHAPLGLFTLTDWLWTILICFKILLLFTLYFCSMRIVLPLNRNLLITHYMCTYILSTLFHHTTFSNMYFSTDATVLSWCFLLNLTLVCIVELDIFVVVVFYLIREGIVTYYGEDIALFWQKCAETFI